MRFFQYKNVKRTSLSATVLFLAVVIVVGFLISCVLFRHRFIKVTDFDSCREFNNGVVLQVVPARCLHEGVMYIEAIPAPSPAGATR